ncbi:MAG: zinc ribbon domain-containing protein [Candidatus Hodarchaeota archaeon]
MKLETMLCYLDGNNIVLITRPRNKIYIPFKSHPHFDRIRTDVHGEITLKINKDRTIGVYIPFIEEIEKIPQRNIVSIDVNERSIDLALLTPLGFSFESLDTSSISTTHYTYSLKRRSIAKNLNLCIHDEKNKRKTLLQKYGNKEKNKIKHSIHDIANKVVELVKKNDAIVVMEKLAGIRQSNSRQKNLNHWQQCKSKKIRRRLNRWNFRQFQKYVEYKSNSAGYLVEYVNPRDTSKVCLKCGKKTKINGQIFTCNHCGYTINRHFLATINIAGKYLKNQNVASSVPAERQQMKMMHGAFRKCKETIIQGAICNENVETISTILS